MFSDRIQSCRVVVDSPHRHHHQGKVFNVKVQLDAARATTSSSTWSGRDRDGHEDVYVVLRDAFDAAKRQLQQRMSSLRGDDKRRETLVVTATAGAAESMTAPLLFAPLASRAFGERMAAALGTRARAAGRARVRGRRAQDPAAGQRARPRRLRRAVAERRCGGQRERPPLSPAVPDRRPQGLRRSARHGLRAVPRLRAQGPPHQGARSGHAALRGAAVRGRRRRSRARARRAQSRRVRERVPLHASTSSRPRRCSPTTSQQARAPARVTIVSPDFGGAKRAQRLQDLLAVRARAARSVSPSSRSAAAAAWSAATCCHRPRRGLPRRHRRRPDQRRLDDPARREGLSRSRRAAGRCVRDARRVRAGAARCSGRTDPIG